VFGSLGWGLGLAAPRAHGQVSGKTPLPDIAIEDEVAGNLKRESDPTPTRPKVAGKSSAESLSAFNFGSLAGDGEDPKMRLELTNRFGNPVPDPRSQLAVVTPGGESAGRNAASGDLRVRSHEFDLRMRFFEEPGMKVSSVFRLPIRSAKTDGASVQSQGTEVGGFDAGLEIRMAEHLTLEALYSDRRSDTLQLHEAHSDFLASLTYYDGRINADRGFAIQARFGLEAGTPLGQSTLSDRISKDRGSAWGIRARLGGRMEFSPAADFRAGTDAFYRRISSYKVGGEERGGAGLFALEPYLEYGLNTLLNLRASVAIPLSRPAGREDAFGRPELPGLYGKSFALGMTVGFL